VCIDYLRKIIVQGRSSKTTKVGDIMTEEVTAHLGTMVVVITILCLLEVQFGVLKRSSLT
jgi:hypothetical protein